MNRDRDVEYMNGFEDGVMAYMKKVNAVISEYVEGKNKSAIAAISKINSITIEMLEDEE